MNWITLEELDRIHAQVLRETGGAAGVLKPDAHEAVLQRPFSSFGGVELFPDLFSKVAALVHAIIAFHPFADGNKRTALVAGDVVCASTGTNCWLRPRSNRFSGR